MHTIGSRLREERVRLNLKQQSFAACGGVLINAQGQYEKGSRSPRADYLLRVASLGVDILYVITGQKSLCTDPGEDSQALFHAYSQLCESDQVLIAELLKALAKHETSH